jgi:hypothetical protein
MKELDVWEVMDDDEEGNPRTHVAYFSNQAIATRIQQTSRYSIYPPNAQPRKQHLRIFDTEAEFLQSITDDFRQRALAKLTKEERAALGL